MPRHNLKNMYKFKNRKKINRINTNWYVVTGGPGSGKTTTVNLPNKLGCTAIDLV